MLIMYTSEVTFTHLTRGSYKTNELGKFLGDQSICMCANDPCSTIEYSYCSRSSAVTSHIDHFILSENAIDMLLAYDSIDAENIFSEQFPLKCVICCMLNTEQN